MYVVALENEARFGLYILKTQWVYWGWGFIYEVNLLMNKWASKGKQRIDTKKMYEDC